jgi:hypothetical protein
MTANGDLVKLLKGTPRARFYLCDLHVHSPASADIRSAYRFSGHSDGEQRLLGQVDEKIARDPIDYEQQVLKEFPPSTYHQMLVERRDMVSRRESIAQGEDWAVIAITDHNVCEYAAALASFAWEQRQKSRLTILPGLELDVTFPVTRDARTDAHIILIYPPCTKPSDIRVAIRDATGNNWTFGAAAETESLPDLIRGLRNHCNYPAVAVAAHVASSRGVRAVAKKRREEAAFTALDAAIARTSGEIDCNADADREALRTRLEKLQKDREIGRASCRERV